MSSLRIIAAVGPVLSILAAACSTGQASASSAAEKPPVPVQLADVTPGTGVNRIQVAGVLAGKEEVSLSFKIGGIVSSVAVHPGDVVRESQILADLTTTEIDATIQQAVEAREKAARDLARARALYADSVATLEQVQNATTALSVADQALRIARFNGAHAVIRAPSGGVVLRRYAEPGQLVNAGAPVLQLRSNAGGLVFRAALPDRDAVRVRRNDAAAVTFDALPDHPLEGRVSQIGAAANSTTGTYDVEIALPGAPQSLASGLIGRARIAVRAGAPAPTIPVEAVVEADGDSAIVFVLPAGSDTVERRRVTIGPDAGARITVVSGLALQERVVVGGGAWLDHGTRVRVTTVPGALR